MVVFLSSKTASREAGRSPPECIADFEDSTGFTHYAPSGNREKLVIEEGFPPKRPDGGPFCNLFSEGETSRGFSVSCWEVCF